MLVPHRSFVRIEGTDLHWVTMGEGPTVVLLHGLTDSHRTWSRVAPILAKTHRVLMPDLPGHGLSSRPDASYALEWHARVIARWLDAIGVEQADIIGHSYGGGVAQWLLLERRERVRRLGLVAAGGLGREVTWALRLAAIPRVVEETGQPFMGIGTNLALRSLGGAFDRRDIAEMSWMNSQPGSARALARTVRDVISLGGQHRNFLDHAHRVGELPPIGVYWGASDPIIPMQHAKEFLSVVDGASFTRFDGCGHFPHREQPAAFAEAVRAFIDADVAVPSRMRRVYAASPPKRTSWLRRLWQRIFARAKMGPPQLTAT